MRALIFTCPITGFKVQHWLTRDDDVPDDEHEGVNCPACGQVHFINCKTGKVFGQREPGPISK